MAAWFVTRPSESTTEPGDVTLVDGGTGIITTADSQASLIARLDSLAAQQDEIRAMLLELRRPRDIT